MSTKNKKKKLKQAEVINEIERELDEIEENFSNTEIKSKTFKKKNNKKISDTLKQELKSNVEKKIEDNNKKNNNKKNNNNSKKNKTNESTEKQEDIIKNSNIESTKKELLDENKDKEIEEVRKATFIEYVIAICLVFGICFAVYFFFIRIKEEPSNKNDVLEMNNEEIKEYGRDKFYYINSINNINTNQLVFFTDRNLTYKDLSNNDKLSIGYNLISIEDRNQKGKTTDECFNASDYPSDCFRETFDKNILLEQLRNVFGKSIDITYMDFKPSVNVSCYLKENSYECRLNRGELVLSNLQQITMYSSSEIKNNQLIVYSYILSVKAGTSFEEEEKGVYSDALGQNKIDDLNYYNQLFDDSISQEDKNELINHYIDKATKYKSTFDRNGNDYVWISTEIES